MWWRELGPESTRSLLAACNEPPEHAFRVNTLRTDRDAVLARLRDTGVAARPAVSDWPLGLPETIVIDGQTGDVVPEMVAAGELTPQSRGSAAVVAMLDPQPGEHVLDLCAGPGIKTGQIAERMGDRGEVISVESDPDRAAEVAEQAQRLGLRSVTVLEADATGPGMGPGFDRVLLDAPCSDLGALASRPDARWRKSPATIERLVEVQAQLFERAREALRPGGTLVYSTCTISPDENERLVDAFLAERPDFAADDLGSSEWSVWQHGRRPMFLQTLPHRHGTDGFFIARLRRSDSA